MNYIGKAKYKDYNTYLFDFDGCIANTLDLWLESYREVFAMYKLEVTDDQIVREIFGSWDAPKYFGINDLDKFKNELVELVRNKYLNSELFPNIGNLLKTLKERGKKIGIVSSSDKQGILAKLTKEGLLDYFDLILGKDDVIEHKPSPEVIISALRTLNMSKYECVIVGDSRNDILAGQNAGIDTILFYPQTHKKFYNLGELQSLKPTFIIQGFEDLL